jgi:hypothetical protein
VSKSRRNSAWISGALDAKQRSELEKALSSILPGTRKQRSQFVAVADLEIDAYRKLLKPNIANAAGSAARLAVFERAARAYARALEALNSSDFRQLQRGLIMARRRRLRSEIDAVADAQLARAGAELEGIKASGLYAKAAVEAVNGDAQALRAHVDNAPRRRNTGAPVDAADRGLVKRIAENYAAIFGVRPSPARDGTFDRALQAIFLAAGIPIIVGEKRLTSIINQADVLRAAAPMPGPKRRLPK